jgi:polyhydroxyalkanoate synthesis regulator phasin
MLDDEAVIALDKYQKIKDLAKTLVGKGSINKETKDYINSLEKEYQKKTLDKIIKLSKTPKSDWDKMSILYARTNRTKAILFKSTYGELKTNEELNKALYEMKGLGLSLSKDFINEYKKIKDL